MKWYLTHVTEDEFRTKLVSAFDHKWLKSLDWRQTDVPSSVQYSAFGIPLDQLYTSDRIQQLDWMRKKYWLYSAVFLTPVTREDEEAVLSFKGIDYKSRIYLNGSLAARHEGMFSPVEIALEAFDSETEIEVLVVIEPFESGKEPYENLKARYSYGNGWDFTPKLQSSGIWDDASIEVRKKLRVLRASVNTQTANQQRADTVISIDLSETVQYGAVTVALGGVTRTFPVVKTDRLALPLNVPSPKLWWPNGLGDPYLYELTIDLCVEGRGTERFSQQVGLRSIERVACTGQGVENIPLQLVINNFKVFIKGVNWVPADACPGSITKESYETFLKQFKEAGINLIRVWGGGLKEKDDFYTLADRYGLMVMQEFPLACQQLAQTERFYSLLEQEAAAIIQSLKHHPSIVIWCGGNEHYHFWDTVDSGTEIMEMAKPIIRQAFGISDENREWQGGASRYDEPSLGLLGHLCALLDPSRPFQITSGMEGEGEVHGIWNWNPRIGDHRYRDYASLYDFWMDANQHLYSEASVSSIANLETIRKVLGTESPGYPDKDDPIWQLHHAFKACWDGLDDLWLDLPSTERLFGKLDNLEDLVFANQWMQGEGGRFLIEEIRRKMGRTSGVIWWGVNEPWPGLAGNALIDYYGTPKLGMNFVANAYRPVILSLRYGDSVCRAFKPELWISNDTHSLFKGTYNIVTRYLESGDIESVEGRIHGDPYSSSFIRLLPRVRMNKGVRLHVECRLFDEDGTVLHQNDYFFASGEDDIPFDSSMRAYMKSIHVKSESRNHEG